MSANSNGASGNSWTLLTPEQAGVENVGPVADGTKTEDPAALTAKSSVEVHGGPVINSTEAPLPKQQCDSVYGHESEDTKQVHPPEPQVKPSETESRAQLNAAEVNEDPSTASDTVKDLSSWTPDHQEQDVSTGHSESPDSLNTDVDSFSDSYTHISSTSGSSAHSASVCQDGEGFSKSEESHLKKNRTEELTPDVKFVETKEQEDDGLRKRKITHLGSLDQEKTEEEDDEEDEDFQLPQREEEKVFSLNKCILAAVILLGLGTIFFSGVLMDLDDEGDNVDVKEFKDPANKDWLNPDIAIDTPVGLEPPDILSKQANDDQQILALQAQLEKHQGDLKAAQRLAEEGEKERVRREELEKDYQKIKEELDRVPDLQKELEQENVRIKEESERAKKELEALPSLHKELEHLRAQVSEFTHGTVKAEHPVDVSGMPSSGDIRNIPPIEPQHSKHVKYADKKGEEKEQSKKEKELKKKSGKKDGKNTSERDVGGKHAEEKKDWKKDKSNPVGKEGKDKEWKDEKEWKKDKKRGDAKMGKENDQKEWDEKKGGKEEKKLKKGKHEGHDESRKDGKDWDSGNKKVKENKEKEWKQRGEKKDWKEEKERKQKEERKVWKEGNEWKQKGERKDRKEEKEWKHKGDRKDWKEEKEWKHKGDRKEEKEWTQKGERKDRKEEKEWKQKEDRKDWKEEKEWKQKEEDEWKNGKQSGLNEKKKEWKAKEEKQQRKGKSEGKVHDKTEKNGGLLEKESNEIHWKGKKSTDGEMNKDQGEKKNKAYHHKDEKSQEKRYKNDKEWSNNKKHGNDKGHGESEQTSSHQHNNQKQRNGGQLEYWPRQRQKLQHNSRQTKSCNGVTECARVEGLSPVNLHDFEILLQSYLKKIQFPEDQTSGKEELSKLVREFFTDGVFAHDQMPFSEFVEDVADILEDMADGEESDEEESAEDDDDADEEMEEFEREAMEKFALPEEAGKKKSRKVRV